jgi:signal transduction histidine kinase
LAIRDRPVFGILQIGTSAEVDENHLTALSTVANHLSLALDRFATSRREVRAREHAQFLEHQAMELLRREEEAHAKAEAAIRTRDEFLALASHDLNDLMSVASLSGYNLLNTRTWTEAAWREQVEGFVRSVKLMRVLLKDLIDTAAVERERLLVSPRPHPVAPLVIETVDTYRVLAAARDIAIRSQVPADLPFISVDGRRFEQVLGNLLKNAIAFSPAGDTITIHAEQVNDEVRFLVTDHGPGVAPEHQKLVFQRSWRGRPGGSTGHGLGLFIAKTLVEGHGGRIGVDTPDQGSTFWFTMPVARSETE